MKKQIELLLVSLSLVGCAIPIQNKDSSQKSAPSSSFAEESSGLSEVSSSEDDSPSVGLSYSLNSSSTGYLVSGRGTCVDSRIVFPSAWEGRPVLGVADNAFEEDADLTSLVIPGSIVSLGKESFSQCENLASVVCQEGLKTIDDQAFYWCHSLSSISLPSSLTQIGQLAFFDTPLFRQKDSQGLCCTNSYVISGSEASGKIALEEGTLGLADHCFYENRNVTELRLNKDIHFVGLASFAYMYGLKTLYAPETMGAKLGNYIYLNFQKDASYEEEGMVRWIRQVQE